MNEWQVLEHDHCAAEWYFQSVRRRLVEDELVNEFPLFYGNGVGKTMAPCIGLRAASYPVNWRDAKKYFEHQRDELPPGKGGHPV